MNLIVNPKLAAWLKDEGQWNPEIMVEAQYVEEPPPTPKVLPTLPKFLEVDNG